MINPDDVKAFQAACGQLDKYYSPLYKDLIKEEFEEFMEAYDDNDEVEMVDACMDMIWVIIGFAHTRGYDIPGAWGEVTRTNLAKLVDGKIVRDPITGKIKKPDGWEEPDFSKYV